MNIIHALWKYRTVIGIAISLGLFGYYVYLADLRGKERDELSDKLTAATQVIRDMRAWHDATVAALERKVEGERERHDFEQEQIIRNQEGRKNGDGPLAPVLADGLQRLRERQAARSNRNP